MSRTVYDTPEDFFEHAEWIEWVDTWGSSSWQPILQRQADAKPSRCYSLGFIIRETDDAIVLAMSIDSLKNCDHALTIPKHAIVNRWTIR